jgi:PleD family two-component response regulator
MGYNILAVDELGSIRIELANLLKNLNVEILSVKDELEAINILDEGKSKINIIVWTINSADYADYEAVKRVKSKETYKNIPIIIISKFTDKKYVIKAIESGAIDYIAKPYEESIVLKKFCNILKIPMEAAKEKNEQEDIVTYSFIEMFAREAKSASRGNHVLSLMLITVTTDVPDTKRHDKPDEIIELINKVMKTKLRETDSVFFYGNGNLIFLLPFTSKEGVKVVDKKIQHIFETHSLVKKKNSGYSLITASVTFPEDGKIKEKLLEKLEQNFINKLNMSKTKVENIE